MEKVRTHASYNTDKETVNIKRQFFKYISLHARQRHIQISMRVTIYKIQFTRACLSTLLKKTKKKKVLGNVKNLKRS